MACIYRILYWYSSYSLSFIIKYNFIAYIAVFSMLILTLTGWDRFIPKFALPREPKVRLKTKEEIAADEAALRV